MRHTQDTTAPIVNVCVVFVVVEKRCLFGDLTEYVDSPCQNEEVTVFKRNSRFWKEWS